MIAPAIVEFEKRIRILYSWHTSFDKNPLIFVKKTIYEGDNRASKSNQFTVALMNSPIVGEQRLKSTACMISYSLRFMSSLANFLCPIFSKKVFKFYGHTSSYLHAINMHATPVKCKSFGQSDLVKSNPFRYSF